MTTFGFLGRLKGYGVFRLVALKAGILPEFAAFGKYPVLLIGQFLIMALAFDGWTQAQYFARRFVRDDVILSGVALFLARVIRLLARVVLGTTDGTFGAIDDKF